MLISEPQGKDTLPLDIDDSSSVANGEGDYVRQRKILEDQELLTAQSSHVRVFSKSGVIKPQ